MAQKYSFYNDPSIKLIDPVDWDDKSSIKEELKNLIATSNSIDIQKIDVSRNNPENGRGDYSSNVAMLLAKEMQKNPMDLATEIASNINNDDLLEKVEAVKPGFINFYIRKAKIVSDFANSKNDHKPLKDKRIMLEFAHPNPFKAFHIGHLRNIILGESLVRLLENAGAEVIRTNYQGDVGMHIAKCLWAFKQVSESDYPTDVTKRVELIAKCYTQGAQAFEDPIKKEEIKEINKKIYTREDPKINKLWALGKQWSLDKFHEIYKKVDTTFDREYMETETLENCKKFNDEAVQKGILEKSEGAIVFKGEKYGLGIRVFLNSQGLPTYEGKELGLAYLEFHDFGNIDLCIHNVAVEQIDFFKVTFKVEELLDPETYKGKQYHNAYEFVGLKSGKMSSRTGNVVLGEDIINEAVNKIGEIVKSRDGMANEDKSQIAEIVGVGAIKYSFLNISPQSYLAFDMEKSLSFEGSSGPYIQYTYTRANKIVVDSAIPLEDLTIDEKYINENASLEELNIIKNLMAYNTVTLDAAKHLAPNILTNYLFDLSQSYNKFYKFNSILKADNNDLIKFRVMLTLKIRDILKEGLGLLGIGVPTSM